MCVGIDPNLAFMGVVALAMVAIGIAVHVLRDILEKLLAAQRAGDQALVEYRQAYEDYEYRLAMFNRARDETAWKHDVRPAPARSRSTAPPSGVSSGIDWSGVAITKTEPTSPERSA